MSNEKKTNIHTTRNKLAERWDTSGRTVDRIKASGQLPWIDLSGGKGKKPIVRFRLEDIEAYEQKFRMAPLENMPKEEKNEHNR